MNNTQPKKISLPVLERLRQPRSALSRRISRALTVALPSQRIAPVRSIPRDVNLRVHLTMLQWFLHQELPDKFPHLFAPSVVIEALPNQGWSNFAFLAHTLTDDYVVRMRADDRVGERREHWAPYHKEEWILEAIAGKIPAPRVVGEGIGYVATPTEVKPYAYFIQSYIPCGAADTVSAHLDPIEFRARLGAVAREINSVRCQGFGTDFKANEERFIHSSWSDAVYHDIREATIDRMISSGILNPLQAKTLLDRFLTLTSLEVEPTLYHGDFVENWSNVLADRSGTIQGIIDWELAGSGPGFQMECALLLYMMIRDGRTKKQIEQDFFAFLSGYGLSPEEYRERYAFDVETIVLLQAIKKCNRYLDIDASGGLRQHAWRMRFFERCKALIGLGARLSEVSNRRMLFCY